MVRLGSMKRMSQHEATTEVHAVARLCSARVEDALSLLSSAAGLAIWNLGLWYTQEQVPGLLSGRSLFGGGHGLAQVQVDAARGWVDYRVGSDAQRLVPRIQARVQPGAELGFADDHCVVTLMAWRSADMDDGRWRRLCSTHEVEIDIIRAELGRVAGAAG